MTWVPVSLADFEQQTITSDGDEFMLAVPGAEGHLVRTGRGSGDAAVTAWRTGSIQIGLLEVGFPSAAEAGPVGGSIVLATMLTAPPGCVWDGTPVRSGQTFVYPVGSNHHAIDPPGLCFALTSIPSDSFHDAAASLGYDASTASKKVTSDPGLWTLMSALTNRRAQGAGTAAPPSADRILEAAVRAAFRETLPIGAADLTRRAVDAELVDEALRVIEARSEWRVPMLVLCRHLNISERRLQLAFDRVLGVGPLAFMQHRALQAAHRRLRRNSRDTTTVAAIARDHGFAHPGRFAQRYARVYGELPSRTLDRSE